MLCINYMIDKKKIRPFVEKKFSLSPVQASVKWALAIQKYNIVMQYYIILLQTIVTSIFDLYDHA